RSPVEVTTRTVEEAEAALARLDAMARRSVDVPDAEPDPEQIAAFVAAMDDDLGTPKAMAQVFGLVTRVNTLLDAGDRDGAAPLVAAVLAILGALGLDLRDPSAEPVPDDVAALASARDVARAERDWATADALRDELVSLGWTVEDAAAGTIVRRA
ncbi:MAG TPA: hypothetical protein PLC03_16900, partial [Microthrixaceae bacterium]|nr:hypothetical protein [Microthrixaceae bacterium]